MTQEIKMCFTQVVHYSEQELIDLTKNVNVVVDSILKLILQLEPSYASFAESFAAYDAARMQLLEVLHFVEFILLVSPDVSKRNMAKSQAIILRESLRDKFLAFELYQKMLEIAGFLQQDINMDSEENALTQFILTDLEYQGSGLDLEKRQHLATIRTEITALESLFDNNVPAYNVKVAASIDELDGLDQNLIASLPQRESDGKYLLGTDYPTINAVLRQVKSSSLRRQVFLNYSNRAYPENYTVLGQLRDLRNQQAQLLGLSTYADWDLMLQMAETPNKVREFLDDLTKSAQKRIAQELEKLQPFANVVDKNTDQQYYPWDLEYLRQQYCKQELSIDLAKIAEYFPLQQTLLGLFKIFSEQFGIEVTFTNDAVYWDLQVTAVNVFFDGKLRGQIVLDLYPRPGKYTHARVMVLRPSRKVNDSEIEPGQVAIITNFTKPLKDAPALLMFPEIEVLIHEFGHAIHALLIETKYSFMDSGAFGLPVKGDFLELPSQLLEYWLRDPQIIRNLSHHYISGEKIDDANAQILANLGETFNGLDTMRQIMNSRLSLDIFNTSEAIESLVVKLSQELLPFQAVVPEAHSTASFLHLTNYAAKYYCYFWARARAYDIFCAFKQAGLITSQAFGKKYCREILAKGGAIHPAKLIETFLGRQPNIDAFINS